LISRKYATSTNRVLRSCRQAFPRSAMRFAINHALCGKGAGRLT
jgi:hypothetical protein